MEQEITAIKTQKKNRQRVNIYLDGEYAFGLSRFVAGWLKPGHKLTNEEIAKLKEEDTYEVAFQKALQFISHRPRSIEETRRRLSDKGFNGEVVEITLKNLTDKHYLDDFDFACKWIENRNTFRPRSDRLLTYELRLKGVADKIITQALEAFGGDANELAYRAGINKAKKCCRDTKLDFHKKVGGFLSRRGFHYGIVKPAVKHLWEDFGLKESERPYENEKWSNLNE